MAATNMNMIASFVKDAIQTQQTSIMQGIASKGAASKETGSDFCEYMKANVATTNDEKNCQNVKKTAEEAMEVAETKTYEDDAMNEKTSQKMQTQDTGQEKNDVENVETTQNCIGDAEECTQEIQDIMGTTKDVIELPKNLKEALKKVEEQLVQKIMDNFDVTEDEVKEAMEVLAISIYDLLQTDNLKELAVYVSNEESLVALVTNADMYNAYQETVTGIEEISASLMKEFSVTPEELQEIMAQLPNVTVENVTDTMQSVNAENVPTEVTVMEEQIPSQDFNEADAGTGAEVEEKQPKIMVEISKTTQSLEKEEITDESPVQKNAEARLQEKTMEVNVENSTQQQKEFAETSSGEEKKTAQKQNETMVLQTNTSYATVVAENEVQTIVKTQTADFEGIVRQIVEQIKVEIKPDVSSMELQLNPENLGKVNLHVSSKEGVITAQFFVQNETVKTMMEGQLMVLREAMNEQGVKVEAVEVTVETGQFGRSLEQHSERQKQETEKQAKSYQHRGINILQGLDEETMNEEEILRAHIMRESGNSVDMNA